MNRLNASPNRWPGWSRGMYLLFTLLFAFLGIGFTVQSFHDRSRNAQFDGPVVRVTGVVDNVVQMESVTSKSSRSTHSVFYHFTAPDGPHRAVTGATVTTCNSLQSRDPVPIKYLPGDPAHSRLDLPLEDAAHHQEVWIDLGAGIGLLVLAPVFLRKWLQG